MKIVIAPTAYKGSLSASDVAEAMKVGVRRVVMDAETVLVPIADGGDGTLQSLMNGSEGEIRNAIVTGPLGEKRVAHWGAMGDGRTAVLEVAKTSGLSLLPIEGRNPLVTTTRGLGELIRNALGEGFRKFIIGLGGTVTNDGGAGMAQALGIRLLDRRGSELLPGGAALAHLDRIDMSGLDDRARQSEFLAACDVINPLTGPEGASLVYSPQKGATPEMALQLEAALSRLAFVVNRDIGAEIDHIPSAGAAGGLGAGLKAFLNADLIPGVELVLETTGLASHLAGADLVITGEGRLDYQTTYNKAPLGVARMAKERGIPVIAISGSLGERFTAVHQHGIDAAVAVVSAPMTLSEASERAVDLVANATEQAMRFMEAGSRVFRSDRGPDGSCMRPMMESSSAAVLPFK